MARPSRLATVRYVASMWGMRSLTITVCTGVLPSAESTSLLVRMPLTPTTIIGDTLPALIALSSRPAS